MFTTGARHFPPSKIKQCNFLIRCLLETFLLDLSWHSFCWGESGRQLSMGLLWPSYQRHRRQKRKETGESDRSFPSPCCYPHSRSQTFSAFTDKEVYISSVPLLGNSFLWAFLRLLSAEAPLGNRFYWVFLGLLGEFRKIEDKGNRQRLQNLSVSLPVAMQHSRNQTPPPSSETKKCTFLLGRF